jgi:hypothetical protein
MMRVEEQNMSDFDELIDSLIDCASSLQDDAVTKITHARASLFSAIQAQAAELAAARLRLEELLGELREYQE